MWSIGAGSETRPPTLASLRLIWGALSVAPIAYALIAFWIRSDGTLFSFPAFSKPLELMLTVTAVGATVASFVVPRHVATANNREGIDSSTLTDDQLAAAAWLAMIVQWSQIEAVAVAGFVMVCAGAPGSRVVPFAAVALALMLLNAPTRERLRSVLG